MGKEDVAAASATAGRKFGLGFFMRGLLNSIVLSLCSIVS
jgi:hypothetical protein